MQIIGHFFHAWLVFVTPLLYLGYRPKLKKQALFTMAYGLGVVLFRRIYNFLAVPFGTHTILLIILNVILLNILIEEVNWIKAICITLITFILVLINDSIIVLPLLNFLGMTVSELSTINVPTYLVVLICANILLIVSYLLGNLIFKKKEAYNY